MEIKKGIGVSPGVVISTAVVLDAEDLVIPKRQVDASQVPDEIERLGKAVAKAVVDLTKLRDNVTGQHGKEIGGIFNFHLGLLSDPTLQTQIINDIRTNHSTAEYAVSVVMRHYANKFLAMTNTYLSERVKDIHDIEKSEKARVIVQAVSQLIKGVDCEIVAESVETTAQADILRAMGCDTVQGYVCAPPMFEEEFLDWISKTDDEDAKSVA